MQIKTYNELLTELCDNFDTLISPRSITRANTNILYLIFKSVAKGFEVINNTCVALSNKFDPSACTEEELNSVASIVGTERLTGSCSGLQIVVTNNNETSATFPSGTYTYVLDDETSFSFTATNTTIEPSGEASFVGLSNKVGAYPVTAQSSITVTSEDADIPTDVTFSCTDNSTLLGVEAETTVAFRKRILEDTSRQDIISEIELAIKQLPYVFDASVVFNQSASTQTYDQGRYSIPPYYMLVFVSACEYRNEIAETIAKYGIYPTVAVEDETNPSIALTYSNCVFATGGYTINVIPYNKVEYTVEVVYKVSDTYGADDTLKVNIRNGLYSSLNTNIHRDYITTDDIYTALGQLKLEGVRILTVKLSQNNVEKDYIAISSSSIPVLVTPNIHAAV